MILVTGGTGLVGSHLLLRLAEKNEHIKATYRKEARLEGVKKVFSYYSEKPWELFEKIQWVKADITDIPALEDSFKRVTHVYHCAALISFDPGYYTKLVKVNIEGTANVVNLCIKFGVQKLCYVSSIAAIGKTVGDKKATEENEWTPQGANVYALTKYEAEMEVWRGSQEGVPTVVVNPGIIIGPGFWESGSGLLFSTAAKGYNFYPPSGSGCISVSDTVNMMLSLMTSPIQGARYIAVSENISYQKLLGVLQEQMGKKAPKKALKFWQLELFWRLDWLVHLLTRKGRSLTKVGVAALRKPEIYDNTKAREQLGFNFEPVKESIVFSCSKFMEENRK